MVDSVRPIPIDPIKEGPTPMVGQSWSLVILKCWGGGPHKQPKELTNDWILSALLILALVVIFALGLPKGEDNLEAWPIDLTSRPTPSCDF